MPNETVIIAFDAVGLFFAVMALVTFLATFAVLLGAARARQNLVANAKRAVEAVDAIAAVRARFHAEVERFGKFVDGVIGTVNPPKVGDCDGADGCGCGGRGRTTKPRKTASR